MDLNWLQSILFGFLSGLTDILPVSGQAHRLIFLNLCGETSEPGLLRLFIHLATLGGLYFACQNHIIRIIRAQKLAMIPKRRRKRPLDTRSLMDLSVLKTMVIPIVIGFLFSASAEKLGNKLIYVAALLFFNGLLLYFPMFLPGSNKDSCAMSRVEALLMGLGGALSVLPGVSGMAGILAVAGVCAAERKYSVEMALLGSMVITACRIVFDIVSLFTVGMEAISAVVFLNYILAAAAVFAGVYLANRVMRWLAETHGFAMFAYYSWGASLFAFILFLNL